MAELKTRVEELRLENDYQLRLKDMTYNEKIKELTEKFIQEMESLKTKNQARCRTQPPVALPGIFIWGYSPEVWGQKSPVGSRGESLVRGLGDSSPRS